MALTLGRVAGSVAVRAPRSTVCVLLKDQLLQIFGCGRFQAHDRSRKP